MMKRFSSLFRGNNRSFGTYANGRANTHRRAYAVGDFEGHIKGKKGIGIVPVRDDGTCMFAAIDIDNHGGEIIDLNKIYSKVDALNLPLIVCRSKSGGAHVYMFGLESLPAKMVRSLMSKWASELGYPGAEIFPKQSYLRLNEEGDRQLGNWINLPYFGGDNTNRYAVGANSRMSLDLFITEAESAAVTVSDLEALYCDRHPEAPPCIQNLISRGVPNGYRNEALYNITVYLKRSFPDTYREMAHDENAKFDDPLKFAEARRTISSAGRRRYHYKCKEEPIASRCNREVCLARKFGITKGRAEELDSSADIPNITNLVKYNTDPVRWQLLVDGRELTVTTQVLLNYRKIKETMTETLMKIMPTIKQKDWDKVLVGLMSEARTVDVPDDASTGGTVRARLKEFIRRADLDADGKDTKNRSWVMAGVPVVQEIAGDRVVIFRGNDFVEYLKKNRAEDLKGANLWMALRELGVSHRRVRIDGTIVQTWCIPVEGKDIKIEAKKPELDF